MRLLLAENAPVGMLHLASVEGVITDFYPVGIYHDELYELKDFVKLCARPTGTEYSNAIIVCNKTPWSDWIWTNPTIAPRSTSTGTKQQDLYELKGQIYQFTGWKPDAVIHIYDKSFDPIWRQRVADLSRSDPDLPIIGLNSSDPKFSQNIIETISMFKGGGRMT